MTRAALIASSLWTCALLLAACGSPIVGAECRPGFTRCGSECVNLQSDPDQCGACGHGCGLFACNAGRCSTKVRRDAGLDAGELHPDGGVSIDSGTGHLRDGGLLEAGTGRGGVGSPFSPDGGFMFPDPMVGQGCGIGLTSCSGMCSDTQADPNHCGDCSVVCSAGKFCSKGLCVNICDPGLMLCGGGCVDEQTDEMHCGGCANVCISGICQTGVCSDVIPGSLVVIGNDFTANDVKPAMQRVAGNALFLAPGAPVKTLVYRGTATASSVSGVANALKNVMNADGRAWEPHDADPDQLSAQLRGVAALVVYAQATSTDVELTTLGQRWGLALSQFLVRGGVVVLFETASTRNSGTYRLLSPAGLFVADKREATPAQSGNLTVVTPGLDVAKGVPLHYKATSTTVHFLNITSDGLTVVQDSDGETVVFHRVVAAP